MRARRRLVPPVLLGAVLSGLVACGPEPEPGAPEPAPRLGGPDSAPATPPARPMDQLESSVAERLDSELHDDGLSLQHVSCPDWDGTVPYHLSCDGYVAGVVGEVEVDLMEGTGESVEFDAELGDGVVATSRLVVRLRAEGYTDVRCGPVAAYPARPGLRIVCRVREGGRVSHVVATVVDRSGAVRIEDH
jgi:hypothetical protein